MAEVTANDVKQMINESVAQNNAWSAEQAQKQMDFQEYMSNTAHRREVADLKAAGLNPVLAAGGQGATTAVGAKGDTDESGTTSMINFMANLLQTENQIKLQEANAKLQHELTDKTNALSKYIAELQSSTAIYGYDIGYAGIMDAKEYDYEHPKTLEALATKTALETAKMLTGNNTTKDNINNSAKKLYQLGVNTGKGLNKGLENLLANELGFKVGIDRVPYTTQNLLSQLKEEWRWVRNKGLTPAAYQKIRLLALQGYKGWSPAQERYIRNYEYKKGIKKSVLNYK